MTFLPIVARELRVASRRRGTYWVRAGAALAVMVLGFWSFLMMQNQSPHDSSQALFGLLTGTTVLYGLMSGMRATADSLSGEKREGTIGLLFLTDLKGYDVVLGKLAACSLTAFYGVLAVLPMLAIPLLMGGVTLGEFGRLALVAVNALFFSLAVGMGVSSVNRSERKSVAFTFLIIVIFTAGCPMLAAYLEYLWRGLGAWRVMMMPSVGYSYYLAWDAQYRSQYPAFWISMLVVHLIGWLSLAFASVVAPHSWQDRPAGARSVRWRERWLQWSHGDHAERTSFRRRLLDRNAFFWLAARARLKPATVWAVLGLLGCLWAYGMARYRGDWLNEATYCLTAIVLQGILKHWVASESARQLAEDRKEGALELLLSTPFQVREILHGQWLALQRQFLGPVIVVLGVHLVFLQALLANTQTQPDHAFWTVLTVGVMIMLVADLVTLYWVGMWLGLIARNHHQAASRSLAWVLVLPWLAFALVLLAVALSFIDRQNPDLSWNFFFGWWFGLGLATDLWVALWSRNKLLTEFRVAAERRYEGRPSLLSRLVGKRE